MNMYGLTEQQRLETLAACERIEDAHDKMQKAFRNIVRIFDNVANRRDPKDGIET